MPADGKRMVFFEAHFTPLKMQANERREKENVLVKSPAAGKSCPFRKCQRRILQPQNRQVSPERRFQCEQQLGADEFKTGLT